MKKKYNSLLRNTKKMPNIEASPIKKETLKIMAVHSTYEVRWKNFKGFEDTDWIKIKPITILIGSNNAGKTSFIAPLLLMNQTISSRDSTSPLIIKGDLYDGGNFKEIINNYDVSKEMFFGLRYHLHKNPKTLKSVGTYPPGAFEVIIGKSKTSNNELCVRRETIFDWHLQEYLSIYKDEEDKYNLSGVTLNTKEKNILKEISPINFLFTPNTFLTARVELLHKEEEKIKKEKFSAGFQELLSVVSRNFSEARDVIMDLSYLGPIRDIPHRYYEITDENHMTVGLKGQNTPNLLKKDLSRIKKDLNEWVQKFGFGDEVILKKISESELLYSILFKNKKTGVNTNIANTGFGASQVLPLIVQALVSRAESITIAEQPEIHLNPRLQSVLADLFAYMVSKDQRIIVETHSEHLMLRLRTLVANKTLKPEDIAIYFIEKDGNNSKIREIPIDENGAIPATEWPQGFFADTLKESLALAAQQAKNRKK